MTSGVATIFAKVLLDSASLLGSGDCMDYLSLIGVTPSGLRDLFKGGLPLHNFSQL